MMTLDTWLRLANTVANYANVIVLTWLALTANQILSNLKKRSK